MIKPEGPSGADSDLAGSLRRAFAAEVRQADDDLALADWFRGVPRRLRPGGGPTPPVAATLLRFAVVAILVVGALGGVAALVSIRGSNHPATGSTPTATIVRYPDGIPTEIEGQPVLRGAAILARANDSVDSTQFLIGVWAGQILPASCPNDPLVLELDGACGDEYPVGDAPGLPSKALGAAVRGLGVDPPGPAVVRVHTHDSRAAECAASHVESCNHIMVADEVVWHGDSSTAPGAVSIAQAAAAFGVAPLPAEWPMCPGESLAGVPVLEFPGSGEDFEGVVAVFPTAQSIAAVAPEAAANGESDEVLAGSIATCDHTGTDARRGPGLHSFRVHWLVRENLLVGVQYDTSLGPAADPFVQQARAALQSLGSRP